jgi:hypothetical protein
MNADRSGAVESSRQGESLTKAPVLTSASDQDTLTGNPLPQLFTEVKLIQLD